MITRSSRSLPDRSVPPLTASASYPDPVDGLLQAAVANRPLDDVVRLVTMLEQTVGGAAAAADVLRMVGTDRPLDDVPRLVAVLSRPPHHADHAGRMIRAAATHRPVEEVVELVERLARQQERQRSGPPDPPDGEGPRPPLPAGPELPEIPEHPERPERRELRSPQPEPSDAVLSWTVWAAALALAVCGVAHLPVYGDGVRPGLLAVALVLAGLCLLPALLLIRRPALPPLAAAAPAALLGAHLLARRVDLAELSRATEATLAPVWLAAMTAAVALLAALLALLVRTARRGVPERTEAALPTAD